MTTGAGVSGGRGLTVQWAGQGAAWACPGVEWAWPAGGRGGSDERGLAVAGHVTRRCFDRAEKSGGRADTSGGELGGAASEDAGRRRGVPEGRGGVARPQGRRGGVEVSAHRPQDPLA